MATVKFNVRFPTRPSAQTIFLVYRHRAEKLVYPTGFKVIPKFWNKDTKRVRNVTSVTNKDVINNSLNELETEILNFATQMIAAKDDPTKEKVKHHLDTYTGKVEKVGDTIFDFIDQFIKSSPKRVNPKTGKRISERTIQKYRTTQSLLIEFSKKYQRKVSFKNIDYDFYNDFLYYMENEKEYSVNTLGKHIQTLKAFLRDATNKGVNKYNAYQSSYFVSMSEESDNIYLNESELQQIYDLDLSDNERLEKVRDLFIVGTWTGLRFSDLSQLTPNKIKNNAFRLEQFKTGGKVEIPIHPTVKAILEKYNGELPRSISNQKMNVYLKEVCQLAGLTEVVEKGITKGGSRLINYYEKWQLVSVHTARRSFATNLYKNGLPVMSIMRITGHKTEKAFNKYIKLTNEEHAELLRNHWEKKYNKFGKRKPIGKTK